MTHLESNPENSHNSIARDVSRSYISVWERLSMKTLQLFGGRDLQETTTLGHMKDSLIHFAERSGEGIIYLFGAKNANSDQHKESNQQS